MYYCMGVVCVCVCAGYLLVSLGGFAIDLIKAFKQRLPEGLLARPTVVSSWKVLTNLIPILYVMIVCTPIPIPQYYDCRCIMVSFPYHIQLHLLPSGIDPESV